MSYKSPPLLNCHVGKENILKDASVQVSFKTTSKPTVTKTENTFLCKENLQVSFSLRGFRLVSLRAFNIAHIKSVCKNNRDLSHTQ